MMAPREKCKKIATAGQLVTARSRLLRSEVLRPEDQLLHQVVRFADVQIFRVAMLIKAVGNHKLRSTVRHRTDQFKLVKVDQSNVAIVVIR